MGPISPAKHRTPGASLADANAAAHSSQSAHAPAAGYTRPPDIDNRATLINRFVWMLESFAWNWVYWAPMKALAVRQASETGAAILRRVGPLSKVHTTITRNLRLAFPEWSDARIAETAGSAWETLGRIAGELPHSKEMAPYGSSHIEVVGAERLDAIRQSGKPAIFFSGHLANWELMLPAICQRGIACTTSYRPLNNPYVDRCLNAARVAGGATAMAPKGTGSRDLVRALARGQSIALLVDQKYNRGVPVPFFGHDAMTAPGPARLAIRFGAPLVPLSIRRIGRAYYRITIHAPFAADSDPVEAKAVYNTLLKINRFLEDRIREAPDQWFWMHRRWPKEAWAAARSAGEDANGATDPGGTPGR